MEPYRLWIVGGVFFLLLALRVLAKNSILRWTAKTGLCSTLIIGMNTLIPTYAVALNIYTIAFAAILGFPGVMTLYMMRMIIK